jgi:ankyrin repeat protein
MKRSTYLLWFAAARANLDAVKLLVQYGADINASTLVSSNVPAINSAVSSNHFELVRWMLDHGAKVNSEANGCVACFNLMTAASNKNLSIVKLLVERGGLINGRNAFGLSPLKQRRLHDYWTGC